MFQPARPFEMWSRLETCLARLYGSVNVDEIVAISPVRVVSTASALSRVIGSRLPRGFLSLVDSPSATKSVWIFAASASRAVSA